MRFSELTKRQKIELTDRYKSGELMREIAPDFGVSHRTIGDWLNRLGIRTRRRAPTPDELDIMRKRYLKGESAYSLAKEFPYCQYTIAKHLAAEGIKLRNKIDTITKYQVDATYFDIIDSEHKAYWLGFIFADGYCRKFLVIQLANSDSSQLGRFLSDISSTHPIKKVEKDQVRLLISNAHLCKALCRFPITPKSELSYPDIPIELDSHFIRGYMDGDGGFYSYTYIKAIFCITTNNSRFLSQVQKVLVANCNLVNRPPKSTSHNSYELRWSRFEEIERIFKYLYSNATIWLPRKRERVEYLFGQPADAI